MNPLKFNWGAPRGSGNTLASEKDLADVLDLEGMIGFAQEAESLGIEGLLMAIGFHLPDPLPLIGALARETRSIDYILAYRPGLLSPTLFAQVVNTLSWISNNRVSLNLVAGISPEEQAYYGDFLAHDDRYRRSDEFLSLLHRFWSESTPISHQGEFYKLEQARLGLPYKGLGRPRIYLSGASSQARHAAVRWSDCWLRYGDTPEGVAGSCAEVRAASRGIGLRMHVLARRTREEALADLEAMMANPDETHRKNVREFVRKSDSEAVKNSFRLADASEDGWISPCLWSGAVAYRGGPALCVVGSYEEVARYLVSYKAVGVTEFILSGWPTRAEMRNFCTHVLPLIRNLEGLHESSAA